MGKPKGQIRSIRFGQVRSFGQRKKGQNTFQAHCSRHASDAQKPKQLASEQGALLRWWSHGCGSKSNRRGKPRVLVHSTYQGSILVPVFEPQPNLVGWATLLSRKHLNGVESHHAS